MSRTLSPSLARCYGMARVARVWKLSRASVYRSLKETPPNTIARRPGPVGAGSDAELVEHIRQHIFASTKLMSNDLRTLWVVVPGSIGNVTTVSSLSWAAAGVTDASSHGASRPPRQIVNFWFFDMDIMTSPYVLHAGS